MIAFDRAIRAYPVLNSEFGYERGVDKFPSYRVLHDWQEQLRRAWLVYLAGGYGVYYYHNTAWDVVKPDPEPPGMQRFQLLKDTLAALPYWRMEPHNELAVGGPCLAHPDRRMPATWRVTRSRSTCWGWTRRRKRGRNGWTRGPANASR